MAVKKTIVIEADTANAVDGIEEVNEALDETTEEQAEVAEGFDLMNTKAGQFYKSAKDGFKAFVTGARSAIRSMGVLKVAIAATGIGLLVVAFGSLVSFFTKTQRGADAINRVFKGLGATVDVLIDRLSTFGEGLFQIVTGDFKAGFDTLAGSVKGVTEEIREESKAAFQLEKDFQALQDREIEFIKVQAQKRKEIAQARLSVEDASKSEQERLEQLRIAQRLQNEITDEQIEIEKERARIIRERDALGESTRDDLRELAEAEARVIELETERNERLRELQGQQNSLTAALEKDTEVTTKNEEAKKKQAEAVEKLAKALAMERKELEALVAAQQAQEDAALEAIAEAEKQFVLREETQEEREVRAAQDKYAQLIALAEQNFIDTTLLEEARQFELDQIDQKYANERQKREEQLQALKIGLAANALGAISNLFEQGSAEAKAFAVGQTIISTYQAALEAYKGVVGIPGVGPALAPIAAATATAFGLGQVRRILSTSPNQTQVQNIGAPNVGSIGVQAPSVSFNTLQGGFNQLEGAIQGANRQPIQTYVTTQSIDNAEQLNRKVTNQASFG